MHLPSSLPSTDPHRRITSRFGARSTAREVGLQKFLPVEEMRAMGWLKSDGTPLDIFKNPEQGAATSVWAATAPELKGHGGLYLEDCNQGLPAEPSNRISGYSPHIVDTDAARRLWAVSEALLAAA